MDPKSGKCINLTPCASLGWVYVIQVPCLKLYVCKIQQLGRDLVELKEMAQWERILVPSG